MRILYVVNNAAFFCSHRLPVAMAASRRGHTVALITGQAGSPVMEAAARARLAQAAVPHTATRFQSGRLALSHEFMGLIEVVRGMWRFKPDIVHTASPKGLLYGGLACRLTNRPALVVAISGMGSLFARERASYRTRLARRVYLSLVAWILRHRCIVIVQNHDDWQLMEQSLGVPEKRLRLICGSGVDLDRLCKLPVADRPQAVVLPARLLKDKGVEEFVEAARLLRSRFPGWVFVLVGACDYDNPTAVPLSRVEQWVQEGAVQWWGHSDDMADVFGRAAIVCLPSYREGMPKALMEAAAAGCAVVTTDTIGCREAVLPGVTGELVPVGDAKALAEALAALMNDPSRLRSYGDAGRVMAKSRFGIDEVIDATLAIYEECAVPRALQPG